MPPHTTECMCPQCLDALAAAVDELATLAIDMQIKAAWRGWTLDERTRWAGHDWSIPTVPQFGWHLWFARQDADRRAMIRAQVEVLLEAESLIARKG